MDSPTHTRRLVGLPRLKHRKSRTGCLRCKERRVKCDESRPTCSKCERHHLSCEYPPKTQFIHHSNAKKNDASRAPVQAAERHPAALSLTTPLASSTLPFRLYHTYCHDMAVKWAFTHDVIVEGYREIWTNDVPLLALDHPNLMNALLSFSASYLLHQNSGPTSTPPPDDYPAPGSLTTPSNAELLQARDYYWSLALSAQNAAAANLTNRNGDAVLLTSIMIAHNAFTMLRDRHTHTCQLQKGYEPPTTWITLEFGALTIWPHTSHHSSVSRILHATNPSIKASDVFTEESRAVYSSLLLPESQISERMVYENAVVFLGYVRNRLESGATGYGMVKPMAMFGLMVGGGFVDRVCKCEDRALVCLGIFFGIWERVKGQPWWAEGIGAGELVGILNAVSAEWRGILKGVLESLSVNIEV